MEEGLCRPKTALYQDQRYAAIQSISIKGDIPKNVTRHAALVKTAAKHGAKFVLFPELSLTGYALGLARDTYVTDNDARLHALRTQAQDLGVTIIVGAPYVGERGVLHIAALSFFPDGRQAVYCKQHLHAGEAEVFVAGTSGVLWDIQGTKVAMAVCADITHSSHPKHAAESGASIYAASVLISRNGYDVDTGLLKQYARDHSMPVIMANHSGTTGGWASAGRSSVWDADGELVIAAPGDGECIVIAGQVNGCWHGEVIEGGV